MAAGHARGWRMRPRAWAVVASLVAGLLILGLAGTVGTSCESATDTTPYSNRDGTAQWSTPDWYGSIEVGMTYHEVMGVKGGFELVSRVHSSAVWIEDWRCDCGTYIVGVTFTDGIVTGKFIVGKP
jgi:hypothetical protein